MRADLADLKCVCDEIARAIKSAESSKFAESSAIFLLQGDIGAGKTTLVKAFAKYVGIKDSVTSPTFSLLHIYSNSSCGDFSQLRKNSESALDSANQNNPSLRANPQDLRGNPPLEKMQNLQNRWLLRDARKFYELPRSHSLARNDENLDSSLRLRSAQNDNFINSAESQNLTLYHYDLYQKGVDSAIDLGLLDLLGENGIHFVEWGDERLFDIIKNAFENIFIIQITKAKNDRIYEFKSEF